MQKLKRIATFSSFDGIVVAEDDDQVEEEDDNNSVPILYCEIHKSLHITDSSLLVLHDKKHSIPRRIATTYITQHRLTACKRYAVEHMIPLNIILTLSSFSNNKLPKYSFACWYAMAQLLLCACVRCCGGRWFAMHSWCQISSPSSSSSKTS